MARTYQIHGTPTLPHDTAHGTILSFNSDGSGAWVPFDGWSTDTPVFEFQVDLLCADVIVDTSDVYFTVPENSNEEITIKVMKNNCVSGSPTEVEYVIEEGLVTGVETVEHLNWLAYEQSLSAAQANANAEGECIECSDCAENPCVTEYGVGRIVVEGQSGATVKVYKADLVIFEMVIPLSGVLEIVHEFLIGEIYVTLTGMNNIESQKGCVPIVLKERIEKCHKCGEC